MVVKFSMLMLLLVGSLSFFNKKTNVFKNGILLLFFCFLCKEFFFGGCEDYLGCTFMGNKVLILVDFYSFFFLFIGFVVTGSVYKFGSWYMVGEVYKGSFMLMLVIFLFFMFLLTFSGSLIFVLVGWEGVGVMSFLLIFWWLGRSDAGVASVQAVVYNRVGDFGLYLGVFVILLSNQVPFSYVDGFSNVGSLLIMVGALAKSSQFLFHPWLPAAMEGPTPVSSLLHSSTMVVAGVFLMIRLGGNFGGLEMGVLFFFGSLTMLYGSLCALGQSDMKKVIAFSTTSQLGLMMCTIGMGLSDLAFFHLCCHAFFKSLIFMVSGVFIHGMGNNQDFRFSGVNMLGSSFSYLCLIMCSLSMCGFLFMSGFYSKDMILENSLGPMLNRLSVGVLFFASVLTGGYSFRLCLLLFVYGFGSKIVGMESFSVSGGFQFLQVYLGTFVVVGVLYYGFLGFEECLSWGLKIVPLFVLVFGVSLGVWSKYNLIYFLGGYMYFYNPLIHRVLTDGLKRFVSLCLLLEFVWLESFWYFFLSGLKFSNYFKFGYFMTYFLPCFFVFCFSLYFYM
uniref:NADH:ubiquinone reductase (H(+)-translocating) n=1 Tax=Rhodosoma turcicum TaxID=1256665 RepID=S0DF73_9ASCI|nr:NADH dehydrogenase subunit 5 [Rhodosoma turcicum]CCO25799.1 NADH dehydrogenase subunit 5 [Rhodosoma turcicum]